MTTGHNGMDDGDGGCIHILQAENCRFAYTLNNMQPVRCSIIGDQPLFFMDFDGSLDDEFADEDLHDPFGIGAIERGVEDLKHRLLGYEPQAGMSELHELRTEEFIGAMADALAPDKVRTQRGCEVRLKSLEKRLAQSRFATSLYDMARVGGVKLAFGTQTAAAAYDREAKTVFLNATLNEPDLLLLAVRELRRIWQHKNGALVHPLTFHPDQAILVNRAQHADLSAAMVRAAWELQLAGDKDMWERLEISSSEDLARAYAREAYLDFRTVNNGQAASAVFEAWFLSDRCRIEDRKLIQGMLSDHQGYVFDNEQASKSVSADLIHALGSMPFGKNYLAPYVASIISDPLFTEVRDRSNSNFLWFIKFERSFREAEQELQTPSSNPDRDNLRGSSITKEPDGDDAKEPTLLALPGRDRSRTQPKLPAASRAESRKNADDAGQNGTLPGGNVVYLSQRLSQQAGR